MRALLFCSVVAAAFCARCATGAQSVTLAWDANSEPDLAGYRIYWGIRSGSYTNNVDVGKVTTNTVSGLVAGTPYYFAVTAYNTSGLESDFSNEVAYRAPGGSNDPPRLRLSIQSHQRLTTNAINLGFLRWAVP